MDSKQKQTNRAMRHRRVRSRIVGTKERPRVSVFKSNKHIFVQLIDDESGKTILSSNASVGVPTGTSGKSKGKSQITKSKEAAEIGKIVAEKAKAVGMSEVVFDRGGYKYHGRVKAVAEGLRAGGLKF